MASRGPVAGNDMVSALTWSRRFVAVPACSVHTLARTVPSGTDRPAAVVVEERLSSSQPACEKIDECP